MQIITSELTSGTLYEYAKKVEHTLLITVDPREHTNTYSQTEHPDNYAEPEFTGKYLDLCSKIYGATGNKTALENAGAVVESIIKNQRSDGYLGCLRSGLEFKNFSVWNQAFTILGLTSYHRVTGDSRALEAAVKCAEFVMNHFIENGVDILDAPNAGTQHISMLAPLCDLYAVTKKDRHKAYILHIVNALKHSDLNFFDFDDILKLRSQKGIENFVILMGILKYADLTGDDSAVESVEKYWQQVFDTQIRNTGNGTTFERFSEGGNGCMFLDAESRPNETCVAVGWCELSLSLFYRRQDKKYLDAIDKTLYNHILASIAEDGSDFAYYQPNYGKRVRAMNGYYKCCRYRGFTLFTYMNDMLVYENSSTVIPLLYVSAKYVSDDTELEIVSDYPYDSTVSIKVISKKEKMLKLRVPDGFTADVITTCGVSSRPTVVDGYIAVPLNIGAKLECTLTLSPSLKTEYGVIDGKKYVSFTYGNLLLAAKNAGPETTVSEKELVIEKRPTRPGEKISFLAKAADSGHELCDYSSADDYTVWIGLK